jgi:hypothetical protein
MMEAQWTCRTVLHLQSCSCKLYTQPQRLGAKQNSRCAPQDAAQLSRMRRSSLGCGAAQLGCGAAKLVVRWLAVRQARDRISAQHPMEAPLAERRRDEDSRRRASANGEG